MKSKRETLADREMRENDGLYSKRVRETLGCVKGEEKVVCVFCMKMPRCDTNEGGAIDVAATSELHAQA